MLRKIVVIGLFLVASFAIAENRIGSYDSINGAGGSGTSGCVTVYVRYADGFPRPGAEVWEYSPHSNYLGTTDSNGKVQKYGLAAGEYWIYAIYASSQFGPNTPLHVDASGWGNAIIRANYETTPPVIEILFPQNITYTNSSVPLTFTVHDYSDYSAISWIGYSLDGQSNVTVTGNATLSSLSYGRHNIVVHANDTVGNMGASYKIFFSVPLLSILRTPIKPNYDEGVVVSANITDAVAGVDKALLSYTCDMTWHNVSMNRFNDTFNATIPPQSYGTLVNYKTYANDTNGNWWESNTYSYIVGDFTTSEITTVEWKPTCPYLFMPSGIPRTNEPVLIIANVTEPVNASGVAKVLFSYRVDSGEWWNTTMVYNTTTSLWTTIIPGQLGGATVEFYIKAYDNAENTITSSMYAFNVKALSTGDLNGDGTVNYKDAAIFRQAYISG
jgi:hypothetical protein